LTLKYIRHKDKTQRNSYIIYVLFFSEPVYVLPVEVTWKRLMIYVTNCSSDGTTVVIIRYRWQLLLILLF